MPDRSSAPDDSFADLFAKLPDPRARVARDDAESADPAPAAGQNASGPATAPAVPADASTAPLSRREAREAGTRTPEATAALPPGTPPRPAPPHPAPPAEAASSLAAASSTAPSVARPATGRVTGTPPTLDDLFADTGDARTAPPPKKRRTGAWIALAIVAVLIGGVAGGGVWVWNTYQNQIRSLMGWEEPKDFEAGLAHGEALVTIADGDVPATISKSLFAAGVTKTSGAFYDMLIKTQQNPTFYPGVYKLQLQMTASAALDALQDKANKLENSALLREGLTMNQILPILADNLKLPLADFQAAVKKPSDYGVSAKSLEGWLFPAMYTFDPGVTAKDVIKKLVDRTVQSLDDAGVPAADRQRVLTVASIIQREARFEADFYKVSRVIENRLDPKNQETFGLLQMDSTAQYGYGEMHDGTVSSSAAALADDNPWNTYKHAGLPIGPISNPGATAIDAAMHPAAGPWLYFVTVDLDTGETIFTTNLAAHNKAVKQFQNWCSKHPDSGC